MDSRKYNEKDITASLDGIAASIRDGGLTPSVIADVYDNTKTYAVGDYVVYTGKSYRCITAVETAEDFDSEKWDQIKVLDELASAVELPPVTGSDNGSILKVASGKWSKGSESKELPWVNNNFNGCVLSVIGGSWRYSPTPLMRTVLLNKPSGTIDNSGTFTFSADNFMKIAQEESASNFIIPISFIFIPDDPEEDPVNADLWFSIESENSPAHTLRFSNTHFELGKLVYRYFDIPSFGFADYTATVNAVTITTST